MSEAEPSAIAALRAFTASHRLAAKGRNRVHARPRTDFINTTNLGIAPQTINLQLTLPQPYAISQTKFFFSVSFTANITACFNGKSSSGVFKVRSSARV